MNYKIITSEVEFCKTVHTWPKTIAVDTETGQDVTLLGISLSDGKQGIYIPTNLWNGTGYDHQLSYYFKERIKHFIRSKQIVGHNFTYDKRFIDAYFAIDSKWHADTRIMWHLSAAPAGPQPYGLKDGMTKILGWDSANEKELEDNVKSKGGSLRKGDHYLADLPIMGKYASLDALATAQLYNTFKDFFNKHDYWWMLEKMMAYNSLLSHNTSNGVHVDVEGLTKAHERLLKLKESSKKRFHKELKNEIESLERDWADRRIARYKREHNKTWYAAHPEEWERFNVNSDSHKRELFYEKLANKPESFTESGKPAVDADSLKRLRGDFMEAYLKYEKANTLTSNFSGPYLKSTVNNRLHPGFNICGTVSYRLSGFKPYLLNAPFDEKLILKNLKCDPGFAGVHADLSAIEPTITAHYSEDPSLLKVFRDGLGDIYLDLALELFPHDKELQDGYNPNIPITKEVKERFSKQRKISKVIQLAVQYTGTGHTVSKNLSKDGLPTTVEEATGYVRAYWRKFSKVAQFNYRLKELNRKQGHLRNVIGRIIQVPDPEYKDLSNRFIQSSAHDVLVLWVMEIYKLCAERGVTIKPVLLDCHDSTSNQTLVSQVTELENIYKIALNNVDKELGLCVTLKADVKRFNSLAGLKGSEE